MKTLRDVLFDHHRDASPRLDQAREAALRALPRPQPPAARSVAIPSAAGSTWTWLAGPRGQLAGLASIWAISLLLSLGARGPAVPALTVSGTHQPSLAEVIQENRRHLRELVEAADSTPAAPTSDRKPAERPLRSESAKPLTSNLV